MKNPDHSISVSAAAAALGRVGGKIGGLSRSPQKQEAARRNGAKGGRPKKKPADVGNPISETARPADHD